MGNTLVILGLGFDIVGVFILTLVAIIDYSYTRIYQRNWWERYYWQGWKPISRISPPSKKAYWEMTWKHKVVRYGFIPPSHLWNIVGFIYILIGFSLQILFYLN